jgi:hypothetical protein
MSEFYNYLMGGKAINEMGMGPGEMKNPKTAFALNVLHDLMGHLEQEGNQYAVQQLKTAIMNLMAH